MADMAGKHASRRKTINPPVFFVSVALIAAFAFFGVFFTSTAKSFFPTLLTAVADTFGWFYIASVAGFLVFCLAIAFSPFGRIRLGPDESRPDYTYVSWFAMLFSAGMGIGLIFFGVAEPITHYISPPTGDGQTIEAARNAMMITFFHWGIHAWAIYIVVGLSLAYFAYRHNLPLTIRSALYPILGDRIHGPLGDAADIFAVLGTMFGVATSLGLGVMQVNAGLNHLFDIPVGPVPQVILIAFITGAATISVVSGLDKGIKRLSELNLYLAVGLLLFVVLFGPTLLLLRTVVQNLGAYLSDLVPMTFQLYAYRPNSQPTEWLTGWTLFYWGWWIAWAPFVGMFIARISRGRTIREFILSVLLVPTGFTFIWMTVFGNTALFTDVETGGMIADVVQDNLPVAIFTVLETLPFGAITALITTVLIVTFFVTSSDSGSLVIDIITSGGHPNPPTWQRVFWALTEGAVAAVLLLAGGLQALQAASITTALPFTVVMIAMCYGLYRGLSQDLMSQYRRTPSPPPLPVQGVTTPWQQRLSKIIRHYRRDEAEAFLSQTVRPSLEKLAGEFQSESMEARIEVEDTRITLIVPHDEETDFRYGVRLRSFRAPSFAFPGEPNGENGSTRHFRAEVEVSTGRGGYDILGYTSDQVIADFLAHYRTHMEFVHIEARS